MIFRKERQQPRYCECAIGAPVVEKSLPFGNVDLFKGMQQLEESKRQVLPKAHQEVFQTNSQFGSRMVSATPCVAYPETRFYFKNIIIDDPFRLVR